MDLKQINPLVFAYMGDAIYEVYIREYLINKGIANVNNLQTESKRFVPATMQSKFLNLLIESKFLNEEEMDIVKRARNTKTNSHPKNTDILTYKHATALEALIGYLYLNKEKNRIDEIIRFIFDNE